MLARRPDGDRVSLELGDNCVRLHRVLVDGREGVLALDDDVRVREDSLELAAVDPVAVADVPFSFRQLAEAVEQTRPGRSVADKRCVFGQGVLERGHDRQVLVLDDDGIQCRGRCGGRLGGHGGDRLAVEADLVDGDDRPVLDGVPEVRVDVGEVAAGQHADDIRHRLRSRSVDRDDSRVRDRAAKDTTVQHPRHEEIAGELGLSAELLPGVKARM